MIRLIRRLWSGDVPLAVAFWEYLILYGLLVNSAASIASFALFSSRQYELGLAMHFAPVPYDLFVFVAVWRSARRYAGDPKWARLARIAVAIIVPLAIIL